MVCALLVDSLDMICTLAACRLQSDSVVYVPQFTLAHSSISHQDSLNCWPFEVSIFTLCALQDLEFKSIVHGPWGIQILIEGLEVALLTCTSGISVVNQTILLTYASLLWSFLSVIGFLWPWLQK